MDDRSRASAAHAALALGALGVVFGDIGTSPLYAVQTVFSPDAARPVHVNRLAVYGVISLVFWALIAVVTIQYVALVMRADNEGEGGILALTALLVGEARRRPVAAIGTLVAIGVFGACLFFGDSMITPAISVLSAVEGVVVVDHSLNHVVVPACAIILFALFALQHRGTAAVGRLFGPVMLVWFTCLAVLGIHGVASHPSILAALSPTYAVRFFADDGLTGFLALGGVVLAVTGAEALYADMGHFGRGPIRSAWLFVALPALLLDYMGQGALILARPTAISNPFYLLVPHWGRVPMILLACVATIIASQAVISGAYSVTRQAIQLGYLPRLRILYTSSEFGQIYVPVINWILLVAVLTLVLTFRHSAKLASAYGIAVTGTFTATLALFLVLQRLRGRWRPWQIALTAATLGTIDVAFLTANFVKIRSGGWLPIAIAVLIFTVFSTWQQGRRIVTRNREREEGSLSDFIEVLRICQPPVQRVPGTAVFLNRSPKTTPLAMRENVEHNHTLHELALILSIEYLTVPYCDESERLKVSDLGYRDDGIWLVVARYGFQEQPDVPALMRLVAESGVEPAVDLSDIAYFLSKIDIVVTSAPGMALWRKRLFLALTHLASDPVDYFRLPQHRTVLLGSRIEM